MSRSLMTVLLCVLSSSFESWSLPLAEVKRVGDGHYVRDFERFLLDEGALIEKGDLVVVDRSALSIEIAGELWTFSEGSMVRLAHHGESYLVQLLQGSLYASLKSSLFVVDTPIANFDIEAATLYLKLEGDGIELAHLGGKVRWQTKGHRMKKKEHPVHHGSRLEKGLSKPIFSKQLTSLEGLVYQHLIPSPYERLPGPTELDSGKPYFPKDLVLSEEKLRRENLVAEGLIKDTFDDFQHEHKQNLLGDEVKDFREVLKIEGPFSFPEPLGHPPEQ